MKRLNKKASKRLAAYVDLTKEEPEKILRAPGHLPLYLQRGVRVNVKEGPGFLFSIGEVYDPSEPPKYERFLEFIVADLRGKPGKVIWVFPTRYRDDRNDIEEVSCAIKHQIIETYNPRYQATHANLAFQCLIEWANADYE